MPLSALNYKPDLYSFITSSYILMTQIIIVVITFYFLFMWLCEDVETSHKRLTVVQLTGYL